MSNDKPDSMRMQANFKTKNGTLLNCYADDSAMLSQQLQDLEELLPQVAAVEDVINAIGAVAGVKVQASAPAQNNAPGPDGAPVCAKGCGPKAWREGVSKRTGKPYKGWYCTNPVKDDQCPVQWA